MFMIILLFLRLTGKKGIRQLSIFEVAIIIALGSAAGDPMVDREMAVFPSLIVFVCIVLFYRLLTYFAAKNSKFERLLEGDPIYIVEEGVFSLEAKKEHTFAKDEFFAEMREAGVEHIGQVETAILESNGKMSIFFYSSEQTKYGLPILPKRVSKEIDRYYKFRLLCMYELRTNNFYRPCTSVQSLSASRMGQSCTQSQNLGFRSVAMERIL